MKLFATFALTAVTALAIAGYASAANCSRPSKVSVPDGASASEEAMKSFQSTKLPAYANAVNTYRKCLVEEAKNAGDEYEEVTADWKRQQETFAKTPAK